MSRLGQKITALLLAVVLAVSLCQGVYAAELNAAEPTGVSTEQEIEVGEPTAADEPAPTEEPSSTDAPVEEDTSSTDVQEVIELPFGLTGMPADYVLSEVVLAEKEALADVVGKLAELTSGKDYVKNEVLASAASQEEAELIAAAFNGEVAKYRHGIVTITLQGCTVLEAVTAAANMELPLPAVYPNYITRMEPIPSVAASDSTMETMSAVPTEQTWETWVRENMANPDEYLLDPYFTYSYQWHHDAVDTYAAWGVSTGWNVPVAVIDSGVYAEHEDLGGRVTVRDIGQGTEPKGDHGTHVAGIIAAEMDNGVGGAGIAPNANITS